MTDASRILEAAEEGDPQAASQLLPLVYAELRQIAAQKLSMEEPGQTLDATALVHEAYLRLIGDFPGKSWQGRRHFFLAAAEAMRRILIESGRRKRRLRHGGHFKRIRLEDTQLVAKLGDDWLPAIDEALTTLAVTEPEVAEVVKLRFFVGLTIQEAAEALGISVRTANRDWAYARAWLYRQLS